MSKRIFTSIFAVLIAVSLIFTSACAPAGDGSSSGASLESVISQSEQWTPVTVEDANGNQVAIESEPETIISLPVWATEILLDMVGTDRIVGISVYNDASAISANSDKAALVENRVASNNPEGIVALGPDLVILDTFNDYDGSLTKTLTEAGIVVLCMSSPIDFDQIKDSITTLAKACGTVDEGDAMISDIDAILNEVSQKTSTLSEEEKLSVMYYEDYYDQSGANAGMLCAYGQYSPFDTIAAAAGLVNVCDLDTYSPVDREVVVGEWKPEVLVVPSLLYDENFNAYDDGGASIIAAIKADSMLADLPAIVSDRIFAIPAKYAGSTSHYMAKAVEELAKAAYPELFE